MEDREYLVECFKERVDNDEWDPVKEFVTEMLENEGYEGEILFSLDIEDMMVYGDKDNVRYDSVLDFELVIRTFLEKGAKCTAEMSVNYFLNNKEVYSIKDD